jgi:hypothetical protein
MPLCEPAPSFENVREGNRRIGAARQHEGLIWKPFAGPSSKETRPPLSPMPERNPKLKGLLSERAFRPPHGPRNFRDGGLALGACP